MLIVIMLIIILMIMKMIIANKAAKAAPVEPMKLDAAVLKEADGLGFQPVPRNWEERFYTPPPPANHF